ncbi:hypothetical protein HQ314_13585 [Rhodococcus sp. BP-332]|uniref:hypothetical protein n=1 Tax=Rhodococcus sp. BP-332 TaxID=2739447 RepID=UPI001C9A98F7|nr:hypothetical protein [Rhodococcus sp. BP-332]MBY6677952.1 hypothetical protein [Rhodococcus sp. BP-332]
MTDETGHDTSGTDRRGPSPVLLIAGVAALLLAIPTLVGADPTAIVAGAASGWTLVIAAIVVGVALVLAPVRRRKSRSQ